MWLEYILIGVSLLPDGLKFFTKQQQSDGVRLFINMHYKRAQRKKNFINTHQIAFP